MLKQTTYKGAFRDPHAALSKIFNIINGDKKSHAEDRSKALHSNKTHQIAPNSFDNVVDTQYDNMIAEKRRLLPEKINQYSKELCELIKRVTVQEELPSDKFFSVNWAINVFYPRQRHIPEQEQMILFMEKVMSAYKADYGADFDVENDFQTLIQEVKNLAKALSISFELEILDRALSAAPLENIEEREKELLVLMRVYQQKSCRSFYSNLGKMEHPFNQLLWEKVTAEVLSDIKSLKIISSTLHALNEKIKATKIEADLPTKQELQTLETLIGEQFPLKSSRRFSGVKKNFLEMTSQIDLKRNNVIHQAKSDFAAYDKTFDDWKKIIQAIQKGGITFPWRYLPPSLIEVNALTDEIDSRRHYYDDWPCAGDVISKKKYELENYHKLLVIMKDETLDKINQGFANPNFSIKELQNNIKIYKQLLVKGGYDKAEESIARIELKLFRFAHHQHKKNQWFSFFRRSYFDNFSAESPASWRDVAANMHAGNYGYSGERTISVLNELGWHKEGQWTSVAPKELFDKSQAHQISLGVM